MKYFAVELVLIVCFGVSVSARIPTDKSDFNKPEQNSSEQEQTAPRSSTFIESPSNGRDLGKRVFLRNNWCRYHLCARPSDDNCESRARQMLQRCDQFCDCSDTNGRPPDKVWVPAQGALVKISDLPRWCDKKRCAKTGTKRCPVRARNRWETCGDTCFCDAFDGKDILNFCASFQDNENCIGVDIVSFCATFPELELCFGVELP